MRSERLSASSSGAGGAVTLPLRRGASALTERTVGRKLAWPVLWNPFVQRGEVFRPRAPGVTRGHEPAGHRYGVVLQADELLSLSTVIIAPTSTRAHPASFRPEVEIQGKLTRVLVEQLGAVDPSRLGESHGLVAFGELREVDRALAVVVGLGA
jgi:mRNA interferase MazF